MDSFLRSLSARNTDCTNFSVPAVLLPASAPMESLGNFVAFNQKVSGERGKKRKFSSLEKYHESLASRQSRVLESRFRTAVANVSEAQQNQLLELLADPVRLNNTLLQQAIL